MPEFSVQGDEFGLLLVQVGEFLFQLGGVGGELGGEGDDILGTHACKSAFVLRILCANG